MGWKNDNSKGNCNTNSQTKFKASILRSTLCNYNDLYILIRGTETITEAEADDAGKRSDERNKGVIFKHFAPFTDCISEINNTQKYDGKNLDVMKRYII